jgi:hypothetical protein
MIKTTWHIISSCWQWQPEQKDDDEITRKQK